MIAFNSNLIPIDSENKFTIKFDADRVLDIKPYKNTGKYEIILRGPAQKLKIPIKLSSNNPNLAPQGPKYSSKSLFDGADKLEDIFPR